MDLATSPTGQLFTLLIGILIMSEPTLVIWISLLVLLLIDDKKTKQTKKNKKMVEAN